MSEVDEIIAAFQLTGKQKQNVKIAVAKVQNASESGADKINAMISCALEMDEPRMAFYAFYLMALWDNIRLTGAMRSEQVVSEIGD